mgnify:CR=1 FL=1
MTVKEFKEELECYNEEAEVIFNLYDTDIEVESWTENKYGDKYVSIDVNLEPTLMHEYKGNMEIELGVKE